MYSKTYTVKLIFVIVIGMGTFMCGMPKTEDKQTESKDKKVETIDITQLSDAIENNPTDAHLYYQRALSYYNDKYLDMAMADINDAIKHDSLMPLYHFTRGRIFYAMNKTLDAEKSFSQAISLKPDYEEALMKLAELYLVVKEHRKSIDLLNVVIAKNKLNADAYFFRGMNQKELLDTPRAIASFQKAMEVESEYYDACIQLGIILTAKKDKNAYQYLTTAMKSQPKNPEAFFARAYYHQVMNKYQDALIDYRKVIDLDPQNADAYYNVGMINFDAKKYKEALRSWDICIQMNNEFADAYYMRGVVHELLKNKEDARINFEYTLRIDPQNMLAQDGLKRVK